MPKEQRNFTKEFKLEAVRLVETSGKSITQVARDEHCPLTMPLSLRSRVSGNSHA
jgi:transposase-like protein